MSCSARPLPNFRLSELRALRGDSNGAGHRRLAAAPEREAIDGRDHRLAQVLDEIEDLLSVRAGLFRLDGGDPGELADVGSGDERLVASSGQDDAADLRVFPRVLERCSQVLPRPLTQGIQHLGSVDGDIGDGALLFVRHVLEDGCCSW